jgi:hypothetical protein
VAGVKVGIGSVSQGNPFAGLTTSLDDLGGLRDHFFLITRVAFA